MYEIGELISPDDVSVLLQAWTKAAREDASFVKESPITPSPTSVLQHSVMMPALTPPTSATPNQFGVAANSDYQHHRFMIAQLTRSNSSLMRTNEAMARRLEELDAILKDHEEHLNSIYYTLHRHGYCALQFPDGDWGGVSSEASIFEAFTLGSPYSGEKVQLDKFRGVLLNFVRSAAASPPVESARAIVARSSVESRLSDPKYVLKASNSLASATSSSSDPEGLKTAMLKCISNTKYDDLDAFVEWLNEPLSSGSSGSNHQMPQAAKSRSLEQDHAVRRDGVDRGQLKRSPGVEENSPTKNIHPMRALSDNVLGKGNDEGSASPSGGSDPALCQLMMTQPQLAMLRMSNKHQPPASPKADSPSFSTNSQFTPNNATAVGSMSARGATAKSKTARMRAKSVAGDRMGGFLSPGGGIGGGLRRPSGINSHSILAADLHDRKSICMTRSPILTCGTNARYRSAQANRSVRNLI